MCAMTSLETSPNVAKDPAGSGRDLAATTVTMPAPELARILGNATLAASKEGSRPILASVLVSYDAGRLTVSATDSYWLLREAVPVTGEGVAVLIILPADELAPVIKAAKSRDARTLDATVRFDVGKTTFTVGSLQVIVADLDGQFPNVDTLIDAHTQTETGEVAFMSGLLVKATKVVPGSTAGQSSNGYPMRFSLNGPLKATRIDWQAAVGSELFALIMPTRLP